MPLAFSFYANNITNGGWTHEPKTEKGMQTVRAILMEDIDICLNAAIIEKARNVIVENVG